MSILVTKPSEKGEGMIIYGDDRSGNCLKVRWVSDYLGLSYAWRETLALTGATSTDAFRALNPAGQVPVVVLDNGQTLAQSNAIIWHLSEGSNLIPNDAYARAKMLEWMFWEQYSHEPVIAVRRARVFIQKMADSDIDPSLLPRGATLLATMDQHLSKQAWFASDSFSLADLALLAYTRFAPQGGWDLNAYQAVQAWIASCETVLGLPALE